MNTITINEHNRFKPGDRIKIISAGEAFLYKYRYTDSIGVIKYIYSNYNIRIVLDKRVANRGCVQDFIDGKEEVVVGPENVQRIKQMNLHWR